MDTNTLVTIRAARAAPSPVRSRSASTSTAQVTVTPAAVVFPYCIQVSDPYAPAIQRWVILFNDGTVKVQNNDTGLLSVTRDRGFTLLEALVAGAIFFLAVVGVSLLAVQGANNASKGMRYSQAARVATQEMERWAMRGWSGLGWEFDGGIPSPKVIPPYNVTELPDGGGPRYQVDHHPLRHLGPPRRAPPRRLPFPEPGRLMAGAPAWIPSYWVDVQVTAFIPNSTHRRHRPGGHLCQPELSAAGSACSS